MAFNSLTYVLFLGLVFILYYRFFAGARGQNALLLVASYVFYAWWDWRLSFLMLASSVVDYTVGRELGTGGSSRRRRLLLLVSVGFNLGILGFFKYFDFFLSSLVAALQGLGFDWSPGSLRIVLPIGISFYTFQTMSYTIDVYRERIEPCRDPVTFLTFVAFFPQLVAGPIERARNLLPQLATPRRFDQMAGVEGCRLVLWGLAKKMVLADNLGVLVDRAYGQPAEFGGPTLLLATIAFSFQVYYDFSGYSDIAIGSARLLGIDLMRNFALPFFSRSVSEFWRRWHISLSTWFRDYLYIPLGGSRQGDWRTFRNLMVTFMISGLWHGASWNFVIWGAIHGLVVSWEGLVAQRRHTDLGPDEPPAGLGLVPSLRAARRMLGTFLVFSLSLIFFRARTFGDAALIVQRILTGLWEQGSWTGAAGWLFVSARTSAALACLVVTLVVEWASRPARHPLSMPRAPRPVRWAVYTSLVWLILLLGAPVTGPFVYFQF